MMMVVSSLEVARRSLLCEYLASQSASLWPAGKHWVNVSHRFNRSNAAIMLTWDGADALLAAQLNDHQVCHVTGRGEAQRDLGVDAIERDRSLAGATSQPKTAREHASLQYDQ